jgi:two-component system cell cycle sensor histidine kinase/response regulator CckA
VHGIVTQHGGEVEVTSAVGKGTTVRVVLPRGTAECEPSARAETAVLPHGAGQRVLLVEDNVPVRRAFGRLLQRLGYAVTATGSAEEAEQLPASGSFDLLLTDMVLPGASGSNLAARLRERWPGLRVVLMSGYTEDELVRHQAANGEVRFLQKPVDLHTLAREVHEALLDSHQ